MALSNIHRDGPSCTWGPSEPHLSHLCIRLFLCILHRALYNNSEPTNTSERFLSSANHSSKSIQPEAGGGMCRSPNVVAVLDRSLGNPAPGPREQLLRQKAVVGLSPSPVGSVPAPGSERQNQTDVQDTHGCPQVIGEWLDVENPHVWYRKCG